MCTKYRKIHLFDVDIPGKISFRESSVLCPGSTPATFEIDKTCKVGLGICYDLRFPELALYYSKMDCSILVYPGAFTPYTGPKYWKLLQQARAVDTQMFVVTCSPAGGDTGDFKPYGHSMVVGPDGSIIASIEGNQEDILICDLDFKLIKNERECIPILKQKRINF
jgi:omega-amidase